VIREGTALSASVVLILGALHVHSLLEFPVGPVELAPWNVAGVVVVLISLAAVLTGGVRYRWGALMAGPVVAYTILTLWMGVSAVHSWQPLAAAAVVAVMVLNTLMLFSVASMWVDQGRMERVNRSVFVLGMLVAVLALALFANPLLAYPNLPLTEGLGYTLDRGIALRLKGLTTDPNFFALYLGIPFFIGLSQRALPLRVPGTVAMGVAIGLSLSRTIIAALVATIALAMVAAAFRRTAGLRAYARAVGPALVLVIGALGVLVFWVEPLQDFVIGRLGSLTAQSRIPKWAQAWVLFEHPLIGEGLRSMDAVLGRFSHSTWLDFLIETGIVGLTIWVAFFALTLFTSVGLVDRADALPWVQGLVLAFLAASTFSLVYNPIFPLVAGVLVARRKGGEAALSAPFTRAGADSTSSSSSGGP
jgi:O-antigen ligase